MIYDKLKPYLNRSEFLMKFDSYIAAAKKGILCYQLNLSAKAMLAARIYESTKGEQSVLLITSDDNRAEEYLDDLSLLVGKENVVFIPDFETLPYEERSPHFSIRAQRIEGLARILQRRGRTAASGQKQLVVIVSIKNLLRIMVAPRIFGENIIEIRKSEDYDLDQLCSRLVSIGYEHESEVARVGDMARRGGILDIYSPTLDDTSKLPVRLEFFGDTVESCRFFEPRTQRSTGDKRDSVSVLPVREVFLDNISTQDSQHWERIHNIGLYEGIEQDVSLLYPETATLYDYLLPEQTFTIYDEYHFLKSIAGEFKQEAEELYTKKILENKSKKRTERFERPEPSQMFCSFDWLSARLLRQRHLFLSAYLQEGDLIQESLMSSFSSQSSMNGELNLLRKILDTKLTEGWHIIIQSDNKSQSNRMKELLIEYEDRIEFSIGVLHRGFNLEDARLAVFTDHEIYNRYKQKRFQDYFTSSDALIDYETLNPGDYIVHIDHGIGIYEGLKLMTVNGVNIECLSIRYADNARVYVPTFQLKLVNRFVADEGVKPEISKLGSKRWETIKNRAKKQIEMIADDLVKLYAERSARAGIVFDNDSVWQQDLEESFIYEDTPDQKRATDEIKRDMEQPNPMERLLCGDVGFGKTEVAIRTAFKAVTSGWQVAVLVPTTLLAEQHYLVFRERLAQYPINITMLSRFRTTRQLKEDVVRIGKGKVDIAIGTHRLLSRDIKFKRLGLLIIDEEHRFGVRHKEKLRQLKANVDTLYMSATPIPRTLSMALSRFKEMSLMQTSPKARLPIRTMIIHYDREIIKDAILRELERGGQVLFLHNRVETIETIADELRELLPKAKIAVGHGQMPERLLEKIMLDFYDKNFDVLVATTIIESGIDIPNANTIIINRADMFGLAQLYQLRGRVGRSTRRAYAYLVIPKHLHVQARKRLEALTEYNALGSGYQIAMRDLELRGAGTLLGTKQSGVIQAIGFNYYNRLLAEAIESLTADGGSDINRSEQDGAVVRWEDEKEKYREKLQIDADFFFPHSYIDDEKTRLDFYQRMLDFGELEEFEDLELELRDRFGELPSPAKRGIGYYRLRLLAKKAKLESFRIKKSKIIIEFPQNYHPSQKTMEYLLQKIEHPVDFDATGKRLKMKIFIGEDEEEKTPSEIYQELFPFAESLLKTLKDLNG